MTPFDVYPELCVCLLWIQSALVLGVAWGCTVLLGDRRAAWKKRIWLLGVFSLPFLPILNSITAPIGSELALFDSLRVSHDLGTARETDSDLRRPEIADALTLPDTSGGMVNPPGAGTAFSSGGSGLAPADPEAASAARAMALAAPAQASVSPNIFQGWKWCGLLYLTGVAILTFRIGAGWLSLQWLRRTALPVTDSSLLAQFETLRRRSRCLRRVSLLRSKRIDTPIAIGILRPSILLPEGFFKRGNGVELVLAHELEHHRRRDPMMLAGIGLIRSIFWPQPLLWMASREVVALSELLADKHAAGGGDQHEYATMLVTQASEGTSLAPKMAQAWLPKNRSIFLRRIDHLLAPRRPSRRMKLLGVGMTLLLSTLLLAAAPERWISTHNPIEQNEDMKTIRKKMIEAMASVAILAQPVMALDEEPLAPPSPEGSEPELTETDAEEAILRILQQRFEVEKAQRQEAILRLQGKKGGADAPASPPKGSEPEITLAQVEEALLRRRLEEQEARLQKAILRVQGKKGGAVPASEPLPAPPGPEGSEPELPETDAEEAILRILQQRFEVEKAQRQEAILRLQGKKGGADAPASPPKGSEPEITLAQVEEALLRRRLEEQEARLQKAILRVQGKKGGAVPASEPLPEPPSPEGSEPELPEPPSPPEGSEPELTETQVQEAILRRQEQKSGANAAPAQEPLVPPSPPESPDIHLEPDAIYHGHLKAAEPKTSSTRSPEGKRDAIYHGYLKAAEPKTSSTRSPEGKRDAIYHRYLKAAEPKTSSTRSPEGKRDAIYHGYLKAAEPKTSSTRSPEGKRDAIYHGYLKAAEPG